MPLRPRSEQTERAGVLAVGQIINDRLGWIFREQPTSDFGIDAHAEIVEGNKVTGRLIALQIKSGSSYFKRRGNVYVFSGDMEHLKYWIGHSLPVYLVLHNPENGRTVWQRISLETVTIDGRRWHVEIPATNVLDESAKPYLAAGVARGDDESARRFRFAVDRDLMRQFRDRDAFIEIDVWVNKSLSIREIIIKFDDQAKEADLVLEMFLPWQYDVHEVMQQFFPWLVFDYAEDIVDVSGEIEEHIFEVWLTDVAKKYLDVEDYFRDGPEEFSEPEASYPDAG